MQTNNPNPIVPLPLLALNGLSDAELEVRLKRLTGIERKALALLLNHLGEFDKRRLHVDRGYPSLFAYCINVLGYSEQAAYKRIQAARAASELPEILTKIADGDLTLTAVVILAPHLHSGNGRQLLAAAEGKRTREIEAIAAELAPRPDVPDTVRALSEQRHLFRFTGSTAFRLKYEKLKRLRGVGRGSIEDVFEAGLDALLEKTDPERRIIRRKDESSNLNGEFAPADPSMAQSRKIRIALRDVIWVRDGGRCMYYSDSGDRCPEVSGLEIDHVRPFALGGSSDDPDNLRLMCRAHNLLLARRVFGASADKRRKPLESRLSLRIVEAAE